MPAQRVSKSFKDISMSFKFNPLSGDLITLKNENAIARAVRNIVSTTPGEKLFDPDFGSSVSEILFENVEYFKPQSSRKESSEIFIVARNFK